jgi:hypothetical protein
MEDRESQISGQASGQIVLERVRNARPIRSFIAKKVSSWLSSHGIEADECPTYNIALNRTNFGHLFTCQLEVHTARAHWEAVVTEADLHQAIISAFNHLSPQNLVQRRSYALQPA